MDIYFHKENVSLDLNLTYVEHWIKSSLFALGHKQSDLTFIFCSDSYLKKINKDYLNHDYFTDVITFDYSNKEVIKGDIYISVERVEDNATTYDVTFNEEIFRVIIHGVLHLCGFNDKSKDDQIKMRNKEDFFISLIDWESDS